MGFINKVHKISNDPKNFSWGDIILILFHENKVDSTFWYLVDAENWSNPANCPKVLNTLHKGLGKFSIWAGNHCTNESGEVNHHCIPERININCFWCYFHFSKHFFFNLHSTKKNELAFCKISNLHSANFTCIELISTNQTRAVMHLNNDITKSELDRNTIQESLEWDYVL